MYSRALNLYSVLSAFIIGVALLFLVAWHLEELLQFENI